MKNVAAMLITTLLVGGAFGCTTSGGTEDAGPEGVLSELSVETTAVGTIVTLKGLHDPTYSAVLNEELRAVVMDIESVSNEAEKSLVEVYDGVVDYVTVSSYEGAGTHGSTRIEIALAVGAEFEVMAGDQGLELMITEEGATLARGEEELGEDPWSSQEGPGDADVLPGDVEISASLESNALIEESEPTMIEVPDPPMATSLVEVAVETTESGSLLHLKGDGTIWAVESFTLEDPDRLVMDLAGIKKAVPQDNIEVGHPLVSQVRVGGHADKVRVVVDGGLEANGFDGRTFRPAADGLFVAFGTGSELESAMEEGLATSESAWREKYISQNAGTIDAAAVIEVDAIEITEPAADGDVVEVVSELEIIEGDEVTGTPEEAAWDADPSDGAIQVEVVDADGSGEVSPAPDTVNEISEGAQIYGLQYQPMDDADRIAILSDSELNFATHEPDADTLVVSFLGAVIADEVAGPVRGKAGGPVSLISVFQQPDIEGQEVRVVITRAANQQPTIMRRGSILFIEFEDLGVAAIAPPAFPDGSTLAGATGANAENTGETVMTAAGVASIDPGPEPLANEKEEIANDVMISDAAATSYDEMPEFSDNPALDGPAGLDQAFMTEDAGTEELTASDSPAEFETTSEIIDIVEKELVAAPASLEPPAAVEVLQEGGLVDGKMYTGRRISLDFNDVPVADVLRLIAEVSDLNLIAGDEVRGTVTIRLVDVPWDQALDVVLLTKGLGFIRVGNILRVAPADVIKQEEELRLQERRNREKLEDLMVKLLPINYAAVKDMADLVKRLLTTRGTVNTDERTNTLIIKDIESVIEEAVALVKAIDTETPQVMIEAKIVEAGLDFARELGSEWSLSTQPYVDPWNGTDPRSDLGGQDFRFHGDNSIAFSNPMTMDPTVMLDMGAYLLDEKLDLNVVLKAAESMGQGKVISSPRIVTLDNSEAAIEQGVSIPFQTFESGDAKLEFIDAVLSLKVIPHITADHSIIMNIQVTRNAPDDSVATPTGSPAIAKAEAKTETLVKDGQTLVIGGIYTIVKSERQSRVPYLYRIPVIGPAFRSKEITDSRKELLIFVTPRIVKSPDVAAN